MSIRTISVVVPFTVILCGSRATNLSVGTAINVSRFEPEARFSGAMEVRMRTAVELVALPLPAILAVDSTNSEYGDLRRDVMYAQDDGEAGAAAAAAAIGCLYESLRRSRMLPTELDCSGGRRPASPRRCGSGRAGGGGDGLMGTPAGGALVVVTIGGFFRGYDLRLIDRAGGS
ncbi:hypothetical protein STAS_00841 [Striga asiatica]|uniref:Uncharacterized protein n=1 Tax=Striga asiatica TaxID=4170 RepID=A0A5A7NXS3_STRAF|nr:hypothetical protein STAS_00841 [Striga asiatica]